MTESYLTDDDVSALEVLEAGGDLTEDQVGRLQALENTPFFAKTIQESEANSRRFAGAGFGPDGFVTSDTSSPIVQAQPDPVPPTGGPVREEEPAPQPADDGMRFDLVTPPPIDAVEMETSIRGPRLGAVGPVSEGGDFFRDDEELLEALEAAPASGIMLTREDFQTREELREKNNDTIGTLKTGAGNILSGLWEMAKGAAVEQGASPAAAIGQALGSAAFDPASAGKILVDGVKEASNRVVQAEVTKAEGARKAYIGVRQLWSWMDGAIENVEIDDDRRQAVRNDLIASNAFGQDNVANAQLLEAEVAKRKEQGLAPFAPTDKTAEYDIKYRRYWENEKLNRAYTGQNQYILDGKVVDEKPDIALSQPVTGYNPVTGEPIQPQPYTSMLYGMAMQPDTYVGFGAGYFSKLRVMSRAAAASRPLFGGIEVTAAKAAEAAKMGRDAQKFLRNSTIASGGLAATGLSMSFNDTTGTLGKGLLFFGGILPAMRATGYVLKRVPVANRFLEAGGILRPQALRIIAEESKAGPLGAGAAANTPATQAAAIRAARPASAERLAASGEVPRRYARFMGTKRTRQGDLKLQNAGQRGFDSTLKRVAQNPENPANVRRAARAADELGLTQAFRATDDALGGAIAGAVGSAPFAAIAPDDQTAGGILAAGASLGAAGNMVGSFTSFRGDAVDADIARFMADTDALGGDTKALFQMPHQHLAAMSSLQGTATNKGVDVVALRTEDYNRMVPEAIGSQGYFSAPTAKDGSKAGRQRIFVDLGHSSLEEGTARITQAPDGMFELTVVRNDGSVAYPLPAADGSQPVIRRKSANDFTVKDGDPVSPYFPLNRQPPRIVTASHEFIHALMKSDMFGGDHQPALRGLIYEQYKPDTIQSMAREYAQRLVDAQINNGRVIKPTNDEAKSKLIDDMVTELEDASVASTGDRRAWIADEIVAETWQDIAQGIDVNRIRQGKSADGRVVDAARSAMIVATRALETFGMKFDWATGKPLTNPSTVFRDNPLATTPLLRKRILEAVRNYDRYLTLLEDAGAVEAKGAPLPRSGRAEDWLAEGTMRTHRKADGTAENDVMTVDPDGQVRWKEQSQIDNEYKGRATAVSDLLKRLGTKLVDDNDPTFGLRRAGVGRTIYSGAELPMSDSPLGYPPVLAAFPEYYRTMYRDAVDSGRAGELVRFSNNTVGTRSDSGGPYKLSRLISGGFAKQSEGLFYGMQITKSGGHMNMQFVDTNAFKASALRAINDGKIPFFNNDYKEVVRGLKQLMDNYRNKRDGSYMIGEEGKNILNGLLYGKSGANDGWGARLNARGSIRTYRMDRMNWIERTGDSGYFFDNDRAKNNRMPESEPIDSPTMPDRPQRVKMVEAAILNTNTGKVYTGPSHPQIYDSLPREAFSGVPDDSDASFFMGDGWNSPEGLIDGFVDSSGKFYDREDAATAVGSSEPLESVTGLQQRGQAMPDTDGSQQTGYDNTYLKQALAQGSGGMVKLTRPIGPNEALPLMSQVPQITQRASNSSFAFDRPALVEFYAHQGQPVAFKWDPDVLIRPQFKDIAIEHAGKPIQLAMADRQQAVGGDMGGVMHTYLKSLRAVPIQDPLTGRKLIPVWANNEWKPAKAMKGKAARGAKDLLVYLMGETAHGSNLRTVRRISNEIDNAPLAAKEKDVFLIIANKGVKQARSREYQAAIKTATIKANNLKQQLKSSGSKDKVSINKQLSRVTRSLDDAKAKLPKYNISPEEEEFAAVVTNYRNAGTRYRNGTGTLEAFQMREEEFFKYLDGFKRVEVEEKQPNGKTRKVYKYRPSDAFKKLKSSVHGKHLIKLDNTFNGRKAAVEALMGLNIKGFNVDHVLPETADFQGGRMNHIVSSVELSTNPDLGAVYLGDDPQQAKFMTPLEAAAAKKMKASNKYVVHEAYSWVMLGPEDGNHFLNSNPKTNEDYFPWFRQRFAEAKTDPVKRDNILTASDTSLINTMRDRTMFPLVMPAK